MKFQESSFNGLKVTVGTKSVTHPRTNGRSKSNMPHQLFQSWGHNEGARVFTTLYIDFSDAQGQITLESVVVSGRNWNSSKLSCMSSLPTRMKLIHTKMKELEWSQDFSQEVYGDFSRRSRAANSAVLGRIWPKFELVRDIMVVLVTCKYEEDPTKNEGASVFTRFSSL